MAREGHRTSDIRRRTYEILERGSPDDRISILVDRIIVLLITVNLIAVVLESMPELAARYALAFDVIEYFSLAVFTLSLIHI